MAATGAIKDPTLLFLSEEHFRATSVDIGAQVTIHNGGAVQDGVITTNSLTLALDATETPELTVANMNWAPYRYTDAGQWESYPIQEYWVEKGPDFEAPLAETWTDPDDLFGARIIAQSYYLTLYSGLTQIIQAGDVSANKLLQLSDAQLTANLNQFNDPTRLGWTIDNLIESFDTLMNAVDHKLRISLQNSLSAIGFFVTVQDGTSPAYAKSKSGAGARNYSGYNSASSTANSEVPTKLLGFAHTGGWTPSSVVAVADRVDSYASRLKVSGAAGKVTAKFAKFMHAGSLNFGHVTSIVDTAVAVAAIVATFTGDINNADVALVFATIQFATSVIGALDAVAVYHTWSAAIDGNAGKLWTNITKINMPMVIVVLIVVAVVAIGLFVFQILSNEISFLSLPFNKALAGLVAGLVVAALVIALASVPVFGQLVASIIALIDATILFICAVTGANAGTDEKDFVRDWICPGITGLLTKAVEFLIYDQTPVIDLTNPNRLQLTNMNFTFADPAKGIAVNNGLTLGLQVDTALYRDEFGIDDVNTFIAYRYQFDDEYVDNAVFAYDILRSQTNTHENLKSSDMTALWQKPSTDSWAADAVFVYTQTIASDPIVFPTAGINQPLPGVYLAEGYNIPVQECFIVPNPLLVPPVIPICYLRNDANTNHIDLGSNVLFDVLPETVGGFYTLAARGDNGYSLNWWANQAVPALVDADGDGLVSPAHGGIDPNDSLPDTDHDGLSDKFELSYGTDPAVADTDGDELNDYEEIRLGTDPYKADTDNDGLTDGEEAIGWPFVYAYVNDEPQTTWVWSDPLAANLDGDDYLDAQEKAFGFNPNLPSSGAILSLNSTLDEGDSIVRPGEAIGYEVVLRNELDLPNLRGLLSVDVPPQVNDSTLAPQAFLLAPQTAITTTGSVTVNPALTPSQYISLTNVAGAVAVDPKEENAGRSLWLHLEEVVSGSSTTFVDRSSVRAECHL